MAEADFATQPESDSEIDSRSVPRLAWDSSVEATPVARGWDGEPCILDWYGSGQADLLVSCGGGQRPRSAWLLRRRRLF